jgi:hypothetical protein
MTRLRALLVTLALAAGVTSLAAPTPAQADPPPPPPCDGILFLVEGPDGELEWHCMPIYIEIDRIPGPEPCFCPEFAVQVIIDHILPADIERGFVDGIGQGLSLLAQAAGARDARTAAALRGQAQDAFLAATRPLGNTEVTLGAVGSVDPRTGVFGATPDPWMERLGANLVGGSNMMIKGFCDPHDDPWWWFRAGMTFFEAAQVDIAAHAPVGV